ncbi:MAG: PDZ domain-containing protein [Gemmatimonadetes bacterium]|nr:PDZ domain-containing protein [Gemmatimonadota bacterium]
MKANELIRGSGRLTPFAALSTLLLSPGVSAQEPLGAPAAPDRECVCSWEGDGLRMMPSIARMNRARIGVELGETAEADGRTGIRLHDVEEGGPAARAGVRPGDILLSLNGTDLGDDPTDRLLTLLADVEPGDTVTLGLIRDGRGETARVVTDRAHGISIFGPGGPSRAWSFPYTERPRTAMRAPEARVRIRQLLGNGLELVAMNEGLGEYFGISEGVLVASVDDGSTLGLQAGDVILSIDGRTVQDPGHAVSIVGSYRPDESITFEIMRERRRTTVTGTRRSR